MRRGNLLRSPNSLLFTAAGCLMVGGLFALLASCRPHPTPAPLPPGAFTSASRVSHVTREDIGIEWPLAVGEADVGCDGGARAARLFVLVDGVRYGLNEAAARQLGYADLRRATLSRGQPLWKDAPGKSGAAKLPTTALLKAARDICHP
jgi:hypothetical protein